MHMQMRGVKEIFMPINPTDTIVHGLLGRDYQDLYRINPYFAATIDGLANMLPMWVDGIAAKARAQNENLDKIMKTLMDAPDPPIFRMEPPPERFSYDVTKVIPEASNKNKSDEELYAERNALIRFRSELMNDRVKNAVKTFIQDSEPSSKEYYIGEG